MRTIAQILKEYDKADRITRDHMWIRFIILRDQFDDMERCKISELNGAGALQRHSTRIRVPQQDLPQPQKARAFSENRALENSAIGKFGKRLGFTDREYEQFFEQGHRVRHVNRLSRAAPLYSIKAEVVRAKHCNSGYKRGQKFVLDVDGNFITKFCPKKMCVYLVSQLNIPVALINERLSEGTPPTISILCDMSGVRMWVWNVSDTAK